MKFYSYWRSTAAYRVRIALHYKHINYEHISIDLISGQHKEMSFSNINPHQRIPSIDDGHFQLSQSVAILEYLEEKVPMPSILPGSCQDRAIARYITQIIVSDVHPLNNSGTIKYLTTTLQQSTESTKRWYSYWLKGGFDALEKIISQYSDGQFCVGNALSMADICLIPQMYNAVKASFDMSEYPTLLSIYEHCLSLDCFDAATPERQPDYIDLEGIPGST